MLFQECSHYCEFVSVPNQMPRALEVVSDYLPLTYAYDALARVTASGSYDGKLARDIGIVAACILLALVLGATTLRRRTA